MKLGGMFMKPVPTQKQGNIARPVKTDGGFRPDSSGDGANPVPEKRIPLPRFTPPKKG
jgi:hypothetical protein